MRKHIGHAISHRSGAVRVAIDKYNTMAPLQDPPRPLLVYSAVAAYSWLGEFELLKESRYEVLERPWAKPAYREVASKYYKIVRAYEELTRLNVEVKRLSTWVNDEDMHLLRVIKQLKDSNPNLSAAIQEQHVKQHRVNNIHRARIHAIYCLPGFTGNATLGIKRGGMGEVQQHDAELLSNSEEAAVTSDLRGVETVEVDEDDILTDEALRYDEVMENM